ncbi:virulence-associated protein A [Xenorhabdus thuongxuanensis]|uniref:Virulence-associated protein A n=1 Tax=Xenorhabdus thuongxuanensis TaxID=1873484 RepID=A0A1Q5U2M2_9GAMM|nr:virulence-associated protein A [Xenorhabdus thuongxuanensis]
MIKRQAHLGEIIAETLEEMSVSLRQFAKAMEIAPSTASRLLSGQTSVTPEMALKLSVVIGSTPETNSALKVVSKRSVFYKVEKLAQIFQCLEIFSQLSVKNSLPNSHRIRFKQIPIEIRIIHIG